MARIQVHPNGAAPLIRNHRYVHHLGAHEHPPALAVPLETVADGLSQSGGPSRLITMLALIGRVISIARQRRQHLLVPVGKPHVWDDQVLTVLISEAIRQP